MASQKKDLSPVCELLLHPDLSMTLIHNQKMPEKIPGEEIQRII